MFLCTHIHIYRYICLQISHGRSPPTVPPLEKLVAISVDVWRHKVALGLIAQHLHKSFHNKKILCNLLWNDVMRYRWFQFVCVFSCIFDTPKIGGKVVAKYVLLAVFYLGKIGAKWFQRCVLPIVDSLNIGARWVSSFCFRCPEIGEMIWHRCLKQMDLDGVIPAHIGAMQFIIESLHLSANGFLEDIPNKSADWGVVLMGIPSLF